MVDGSVFKEKTGNPRIALTLAESDHEGVSYLPFFGVVYQSGSIIILYLFSTISICYYTPRLKCQLC
jgi:hypothetical protein